MSCSSSQKEQDNPNWASAMQKTAKSFQKLLPYLYDPEAFSDPKNSKKILTHIDDFKKSIHSIDKKQAKLFLGDDPYVSKGLENLKELTDRANLSFRRGDRKNSRILLKATTNTCFKCHTRQNLGPNSVSWNQFDIHSINTNAIEKTHLLISMRQFDEAKKILKAYLKESEDNNNFDVSYETALHYYIMISLRGQNQIKPTLDFVRSKVLVAKIPTRLHYTLKYWAKDLNYWFKNKKNMKPSHNSAKAALKRNARRYSDRNLINNLIASQILHQSLQAKKPKKFKAKSYYLLGTVYDELIVEGYWDLPEVYYERCIHFAPKTDIAKKCFENLKSNVTLGYSGSRGTMIPSQEYKRIDKLRKMSGIK